MPSSPPNVVVFFTDQQRHDSAGVHGNPLELTPTFDRMAQQGTHLYHAFTCQPVCSPARSCLQTGLYATKTGVFTNGAVPMNPNLKTLAHYFRAAGYTTGYIGKWHLGGYKTPFVPVQERGGYEYWLAANALEATSDTYRCDLYDGDNRLVRLPGYRVDALTDAAIRYVDAHQQQPFFLFLSFLEPHFQNHLDDYPPPDGYRERYTGRWMPPDLAALGGSAHQHLGGYWGMCKRLDEALGRLLDALKSLGLRENTIVLFTSDHACHFKTRNSEYKRSCHESSIRIPTALCGGPFESGGQVRQLVSLVDLPPTLLNACGLPVPPEMQGRSILPLLRGSVSGRGQEPGAKSEEPGAKSQQLPWPEEVFVQISEDQLGRAVRTRRWKYSVVAPDKDSWGDARSDHYAEQCLYDLESDPCELRNLVGLKSHQVVAQVMRERLIRRMVEAGESAPRIDLAPVRESGQRTVSPDEALE
ncbi:MAG: sulfatase-like hydrolase/transferase [Planctomycetota bacterium]|nr:sulfatase-like hydrolase/transferase [Planctomycetota bacterium]